MTKQEFQKYWNLNYLDNIPLPHLLRQEYSERWFRIHSLPESKRHAENNKEFDIILNRQNEILTDIFGLETKILLVTGEYNWGDNRKIHITEEEEIFKHYSFTRLDNVELYKLNPKEYNEAEIYRPAFAETIWNSNKHNKILRDIADYKIRAFFISFEKNIIIAPYDGGVDFILKDNLTKEFYKNKYRHWLSEREDGL
jgi:hypothetical protein